MPSLLVRPTGQSGPWQPTQNGNIPCEERPHEECLHKDCPYEDGPSKYRGVYCRQLKDRVGRVSQVKYEPRFKPPRERQSLWLGTYDTCDEAKIVRDIAVFLYGNDEFGCLDFEDGRYFAGEVDHEDGRYFVIPPLTEKEEGKEKGKLVSRRAKEVYDEFKKKQAEWSNLWLTAIFTGGSEDEVPRRDGVANAAGNAHSHLEGRHFDNLTNTPVQKPSHNGQVSNSAVDVMMLDDHAVTSSISSHLDDALGTSNSAAHPSETSEPAPSNPLSLSSCHEVLESSMAGVPPLSSEDTRRAELPGSHILSYEAGPTVAPAPFPDRTPASGFNSNCGNQVEGLLLQLVNTLQQDRQELKQKNLELETQLSELQRELREHMFCCPGANRPTKKR